MCVTLHDWVLAEEFPAWAEVKSMLPELRSLWHHRNNLSVDDNGTLWRKRSSQSAQLQLLVPKAGREQLFLSYHALLFGGHLGRTRTLARLADRFYWTGMADDVKDWLSQCVACIKRKSPVGRHHPLGHIPTGHRWDRIAMDILDVCDPTPEGFRYILVIADYFSKWTEAFPMKNKCADTVADILVEKIILRFGMPLVIHSDQGREFENGLMKSLCALLGCTKTRTAPYHPESDGMIERFNRTCLMMLSMFVNDRRDNWHELPPFIMHAYRTSVHESTGYSPFRLMMGEECSLPQDVSTAELRTHVMVPDCLLPPENNTVRVDLRHHVGLSLGSAVDMTNWSPEAHLERALCPGPLLNTLELQRREYWSELGPILKRWKSVNDSKCPDCGDVIKINMGRHIRLKHTTYMCFWRCPVLS